MHKQTLCGQTASGLGCGERRGGKEQERKVRVVKVGGVCLPGCETVILLKGVAAVF